MKTNYPEFCYVAVESSGIIGKVKRYEMGYYPTEITLAKDRVKDLNATIGVDEITAMAMHNGSMFGWDIPGANPEYLKKEIEGK